MDEFDFEVTSLREPPTLTDAATGDSIDHPDRDDHKPAQCSVRALLGNRLTRPQRLWRTLTIVTTILLALAFILGANPNIRTALDALLHPVTTFSNSTAPGAEQFDFVHVAPWGELGIDGLTVPKKQVLQRFRAVTLAPGVHTFDYSAPPFAPLHCTLTVPADPTSDTCPLSKGDDTDPTLSHDTVRELNLRASFTDLSPQQRTALTRAAGIGLAAGSPSATVAPGEHYLMAGGKVTTNSGPPMQATLLYSLSDSLTDEQTHQLFTFEGIPCQRFCLYPYFLDQMPPEWGVVAHVALSWSYAVPHSAIQGPLTSDLDTMDIAVPLHITWQRGWHVTLLHATQPIYGGLFSNPICVPADETLMSVLTHSSFQGSESSMTPASGAEGCLIRWREWTGQSAGLGPPNYLLYRFGVLLAANDDAHHIFPTLPLADASEQALAQQLATQS